MNLSPPLIGHYSYTTQSCILLLLASLCYSNKFIRSAIFFSVTIYTAYRIVIPAAGWILTLFRAIAWCGFYVFFFLRAVEYGGEIWQYVLHGVDVVASEKLKQTMNQERERGAVNMREALNRRVSKFRDSKQRDKDREEEMHGHIEELEDDDLPDLGLHDDLGPHDGTFDSDYHPQPASEEYTHSVPSGSSKPSQKKKKRR